MRLRIATYNIRLGIQEGLSAIADVVAGYRPDVLAVQEIGDHWTMGPEGHSTAELAEMLGMTGQFIPAIEEGPARYGTAFFTRLPIVAFDVVALPEEFDEPRRMARAVLDVGGEDAVVYCTHLSHIEDRELQWQVVLDAVLGESQPTILMGDLNEVPDHWAIQELKGSMVDCDPSDAWTFPASEPTRRIDYIFASTGRFEETVVDANITASDHRLVFSGWSDEL